jgi:hypothetical protein
MEGEDVLEYTSLWAAGCKHDMLHGLGDAGIRCCFPLPLCREAVQYIASNILRLAASGADIAGLDSALVTKIAKVRQLLLMLLSNLNPCTVHGYSIVYGCSR